MDRSEVHGGWSRRRSGRALAALAVLLILPAGGALAFEVEPAAPDRCVDLVLLVTRSFASDCAWIAVPQVQIDGPLVSVSLELRAGGDICLPVAREKTFRVFLGPLEPGDSTIAVSWNDLDQVPETRVVCVADAECPEKLARGDANRDHAVDLGDAVFLLFHLFAGGAAPSCAAAADADADGGLGISDVVSVLGFLFLFGPAPAPLGDAEAEACRAISPFVLTSAAFAEGEFIPARNSCEGSNLSPPLAWSGGPAGTKSFALTCLDPDAPSGTFVHWLAWDIPPEKSSLAEGEKPPVEGTNGANRVGYTGPCPPQGGGDHRYFFTLYALDVDTLSLPTTTRRTALEAVLDGHILATAVLMGKYRRD